MDWQTPPRERSGGVNGYEDFLRKKVVQAPLSGLEVPREDLHPKLFEFQKDAVGWALRGGRRALFESFGLGKTMQQLEITRQITNRYDGQALIVLPLGVKQEFTADAQKMDMEITYVRTDAEASAAGPVVMTNYERVRDRSLSPGYLRSLTAVLLDEASVLRGFGGTAAKGKEMHLCPLQFDIVDRAITQYTEPGDVVYDPFAGLGTVPLRALELGRRGRGVELNPAYWADGVFYLRAAEEKAASPTLFDLLDETEVDAA